ncbi:5' exonuclease Apollo [Salarias fasciatus]|uniref:5' exonuclease Apollo n=1 Tax=Salarias fasciatus TaxID=181472 RepID=A0A672JF96_SALFA|nr:5' exonuclease Apollo [Salarias fasciatus]
MSCGKVIPHTPLAVDFWQVRKCTGARLFFLSHMHSDHTAGLSSTWSDRPIYCSPITASLLRLKLQVKEKWIHPLELGEPHLLPLDDIGKETLTVTLIDANHCPGAVMFLFEGYFGTILYTGDFRYTPSMLREPCFQTNTAIDVLYLDDTNCDPNRTLPTRQRATQQIKEIIRSHPHHAVVIGLYALGKESLLLELALEFKTWVEVSVERMETLRALELPDVFTTEPGAGRIRAVKQWEICSAALREWNREQPTLAILPTSRPLVSFHPDVYVVPFSDHSSYQELEDFVAALRPASVVPLLASHLPGGLAALLPSRKRHEVLVPESVRNYMLGQPEQRRLDSSACARLHRRHVQQLPPRGVIFDSPGQACSPDAVRSDCLQLLEEEMNTDSSEDDSDCILVDFSKNISPDRSRKAAGDPWRLDIIRTASDETVSEFGQLSHSSSSCVEMKNSTTTKRPFESEAQMKAVRQNGHRPPRSHSSPSDGDNVSQHRGVGQNDPEEESSSSSERRRSRLEQLEIGLLKNLPFSKEDMNPRGLLPRSFVLRHPLTPQSKTTSVIVFS